MAARQLRAIKAAFENEARTDRDRSRASGVDAMKAMGLRAEGDSLLSFFFFFFGRFVLSSGSFKVEKYDVIGIDLRRQFGQCS